MAPMTQYWRSAPKCCGGGNRQGITSDLEETLQDYDNVTVINDDILKVDINGLVERKRWTPH